MARYKLNFTLYPRKTKTGSRVWYYRTYDLEGKRTSGKSTGHTSKTLARRYCEELLRKNLLYIGKSEYFNDFIKDFFTKGSSHYKKFIERKNLEENTKNNYASMLNVVLKPNLVDVKLSQMTPAFLEKLQDKLVSSGFKNYRINNTFILLSEIMDIAVIEERITRNPCKSIKPLKSDSKIRDSFTVAEVKELLSRVKEDYQAVILTAVCTGMRLSEISGLKPCYVFDNYIKVCGQKSAVGYRDHTKTKKDRYVPITPELREVILKYNDGEWCFPFPVRTLQQKVTSLVNEYRWVSESRTLSFHSLRHTFNTVLLSYNIPEIKVAAVMGHTVGSSSVRSRYTNFKIDDFKEVYDGMKRLYKELTE